MKTQKLAWLTALMLGMAGAAQAQDAVAAEEPVAAEPAAEAPLAETGGSSDATMSAAPEGESGAASDKKISAGLLLGYGISLEKGGNMWGLGFGVRGGYNLDKIFLGARFAYYLGEDPLSSWELGIEGGYDLAVGDKLIVRPSLGLGIASVTWSVPSVTVAGMTLGGGSTSSSELYLAPGASLLYDINPDIFLGAEARLMLITSSPMTKGLILLANGGMRF